MAVNYILFFLVSTFSVVLGSIIYNALIKLLSKQPQRLIYAVDITLRNADESMDDFIYRVYNERLGEYRIV